MFSRQSGTKDGDGVGCGGRSVVIAVSHTKYCSVVGTKLYDELIIMHIVCAVFYELVTYSNNYCW